MLARQGPSFNPVISRGQYRSKAPHKPLLLLCQIDMAETSELPAPTFVDSADLVLRFRSYGALVADRRTETTSPAAAIFPFRHTSVLGSRGGGDAVRNISGEK